MKVKPTIREVKVVLNSFGIDKKIKRHYNDKRVRGGRIKAYFEDKHNVSHLFRLIEDRLSVLFPENVFSVDHYNPWAITVHWKDEDATWSP